MAGLHRCNSLPHFPSKFTSGHTAMHFVRLSLLTIFLCVILPPSQFSAAQTTVGTTGRVFNHGFDGVFVNFWNVFVLESIHFLVNKSCVKVYVNFVFQSKRRPSSCWCLKPWMSKPYSNHFYIHAQTTELYSTNRIITSKRKFETINLTPLPEASVVYFLEVFV